MGTLSTNAKFDGIAWGFNHQQTKKKIMGRSSIN
jgi:hypothetical protein